MIGIWTYNRQSGVLPGQWIAYHPEQKEAQQISRGNTSARGKAIWDVVVTIAKDTAHEHRHDAATIVGLRCEVNDGDHCSDQNVQTSASHTCRSTDVDWKTDEVLDGASTVQYYQDCKDCRSNDSCNHSVPPEQPNRYERSTEVVATGAERHRQVVGEVVLPFPASVLCRALVRSTSLPRVATDLEDWGEDPH
jgi:hypothetical protein